MVDHWLGKKVLVMGLGLHGGGFQVVKWLLSRGAQLTVTDLKTAKQLKVTLDKIKKLPGSKEIKFTLGKHDITDFINQDLIVQNPGVPAKSIYLITARKNNIPIVNEAVMFFGLYAGKTIGITGTRGKSTTASLVHHILKTKIKNNVLAGNIATTPMFAVLDSLKINSYPVLELSSWQLENMGEYSISPTIAVLTNVLSDHLNRYRNIKEYAQAKYNIVRYQDKNNVAVLNYDNIFSKKAAKLTKAKVYYFSLTKKVKGSYLSKDTIYFNNGKKIEKVMVVDKIKLLGKHNLANILAAITVAKVMNVSNPNISKAINSFKGVEFRLQYIGKLREVKIYNDSTSTTPDATQAAIKALTGQKILLIAGGQDKSLDYSLLAQTIKSKVAKTVLLNGTGSEKLSKALAKIKYPTSKLIKNVNSLGKAWQLAKADLTKFDCVLFSPAAASFNMFINEFDRARQFNKLIKDDQKKKKF